MRHVWRFGGRLGGKASDVAFLRPATFAPVQASGPRLGLAFDRTKERGGVYGFAAVGAVHRVRDGAAMIADGSGKSSIVSRVRADAWAVGIMFIVSWAEWFSAQLAERQIGGKDDWSPHCPAIAVAIPKYVLLLSFQRSGVGGNLFCDPLAH
jgi:hypothetical protein